MSSSKGKKKHYINNKEFQEVIEGYLIDPSKYESKLVELLDLLITNILMSFKFNVDFDDAKQECFLLVFKTLKNFNVEKGSAFNYFTTVIVNNLKLMFTKNKKYREKILKYQEIRGGAKVITHELPDEGPE
jgi:DNA-directed RNA polymerase specialized sigma subunit